MIVAALVVSLLGQTASPPALTEAEQQAAGRQAIESMVQIFTLLGSCERHFTPQQVAGVRRPLELDPGARTLTPLQQMLDDAYQTGKADTSNSAAFCQRAMQLLAEAQADRGQ